MPKIAFATRSMNPQLESKVRSLCSTFSTLYDLKSPFPHYVFQDTDALEYFQILSKLEEDWIVNIDEDAFLLNLYSLKNLISYMETHEYAITGMPDGGCVQMRIHNPIACNAFFNIINLKLIRKIWLDWESVCNLTHHTDYELSLPIELIQNEYHFDEYEPYYPIFYSILRHNHKILYLRGETWTDGTSTWLHNHEGNPIVLHTWYSREWSESELHRTRILNAWDFADKYINSHAID